MPVSKHRKKKQGKSPPQKAANTRDGVVYTKHPLSGMPHEQLIAGLIELGKVNQDEFLNRLAEVERALRSSEPLLTISILATYGLNGIAGSNRSFRVSSEGEFHQAHVELVQALYLRIPQHECSSEFPTPLISQQLFDLLPKLSNAYGLRRLKQLQNQQTEEGHAAAWIQERMRIHTQIVRNWGYLREVVEIMKRLCTPIEDVFLAHIGLRAADLIDVFMYLIRQNERRWNDRLEKLRSVFHEPTVAGLLDAYHEINPNLTNSSEEVVAFAKKHGISSDQVKGLLLSHSDLSLHKIYTFNAVEVAAETGLDAQAITQVLDHLSLGFGAIASYDPEHLFLDNPVWTKPVIKLDRGYFCAMPQVFFSFITPIFADFLRQKDSGIRRYERRRAEFLESEIHELFGKAFPGCEIHPRYRWREGADEYENDLMVRVDSHLILIEAKSHSISWPALRGAIERLRRHVKDIMIDPSVQSLRLATRVIEAIRNEERREFLLPHFPVSLDKIRTILRLSITLEDLASLQTTIHQAKRANWLSPDHPIAPCILLADLKIIFDVLQTTPQKIHYLKRRADLEANLNYEGDELDLLGFYLKTGFNIGKAEFSGDQLMLIGMSEQIDQHYNALDQDVVKSKPILKQTDWWRDICTKIQERHFDQWTDAANILLGLPPSEQEIISKKFKHVVKNVHKHWRKPNHNCAIIQLSLLGKTDALAIYAFKERSKNERYTRMENVACQVFAESHAERCLVIGINIDKRDYPYSLVTVYFRRNVEQIGSSAIT